MSDGQPPPSEGPPAEEPQKENESPKEVAPADGSSKSEDPQPAVRPSTPQGNTPQVVENSTPVESSPKTPAVEPVLSPDSPFWKPLRAGWVRELVYRSSVGPNNKKADAYYKAPKPLGKKFRSLKEIERAIDEGKPGFEGLSTENFTYNQYPLGVNDPSMEVIRGADPARQIMKRSSEIGEADSPTVKKPKKSVPKTPVAAPKTSPPKPKPVAPLANLQTKVAQKMSSIHVPPLRPYPQTAIRTPVRPIRPYQRVEVIGPRGAGFRTVPTRALMNPVRTLQKVYPPGFASSKVHPSPEKSAEEIVCEPAIYGIGKSPEKPTTSAPPPAVQKTVAPTPARVFQIVSSKRLTVPFTVPPQDLALDGIATIAPSEDNTYVEGKTSKPSESSSSDNERSDPDKQTESTQEISVAPEPDSSESTKPDSSESNKPDSSEPNKPDSSEPNKPEGPQKRLDVAKLRRFLASKQKKFSSEPASVSEQKDPPHDVQNSSKPQTSLEEPNNNSNPSPKSDARSRLGSDDSDSESKVESRRETVENSDHSDTKPGKVESHSVDSGSDSKPLSSANPELDECAKLGFDDRDSEPKPGGPPENDSFRESDHSRSSSKPRKKNSRRRGSLRWDEDTEYELSSNPENVSDSDGENSRQPKRSSKPKKSRRSSMTKKPRRKRRRAYSDSESESDSPVSSNLSLGRSDSESRSKMSKVGDASDTNSVDVAKEGSTERSDSRQKRKFIPDSDLSSLDTRLTKPSVRKRKISSVYSSTSDQSGSDSARHKRRPRLLSGSKPGSASRSDRESTNASPLNTEHSHSNSRNRSGSPDRRSGSGSETSQVGDAPKSSSSSISSSDSD